MGLFNRKRWKSICNPRVCCFLIIGFIISFFSVSISASGTEIIPYESYTYWENFNGSGSRKAILNRPMYEPKKAIYGVTLGVKSFNELTDVHSASNGKTYILDGGSSRLCILDKNYNLDKEICGQGKTGFTGAQGVFVDELGAIYIADTDNKRVLVMDDNGEVLREILLPQSELVPEGFQYSPIKVAVDSRGYIYVLSDGSFYGALLFSPQETFLGFYGSNTVNAGIEQAFTTIWKKLFSNNAKRAGSKRTLPYQFTDINIDSDNFVWTSTGKTERDVNIPGQIRWLSPGGDDIINTSRFNFADEGQGKVQDILGISLDSQGYIYALDSTYGRVFLYDRECHMLSAFCGGIGEGNQTGTFRLARALAVNGDDVLVCDASKNNVTVLGITTYGRLVQDIQALTLDGKYLQAKEGWEQVLSLDRNNQLAYSGLAKAAYMNKDYRLAIEYSKIALDRKTYSQAFEFVRREFLMTHFIWVFPLALVIISCLVALMIYTSKRKTVLVKNDAVRLMLSTITHPFGTFNEIKEKKKGSVWLCVMILLLFYVFSILEITEGGFLFVYFDASNFNSLIVLFRTVGLILLWVVVNWSISTLFEGKGSMREILIITCYSLIPIVIGSAVFIALSNVVLPTEVGFLQVISTIAQISTFVLLAIGSMIIHNFSLGKFIGTSILTLIGMGIVIFIIFIIGVLLQQFWVFLVTLFMEAVYR